MTAFLSLRCQPKRHQRKSLENTSRIKKSGFLTICSLIREAMRANTFRVLFMMSGDMCKRFFVSQIPKSLHNDKSTEC